MSVFVQMLRKYFILFLAPLFPHHPVSVTTIPVLQMEKLKSTDVQVYWLV